MTNVPGEYRAEDFASWRYRLRSAGKMAMALSNPTKAIAEVDSIVIPMRS